MRFNLSITLEVAGAVCRQRCVFSLKVRDASVVRREGCAGGWGHAVVCVAWKREKVGEGKGGWAGFDRGAGLIAIMIWPITE